MQLTTSCAVICLINALTCMTGPLRIVHGKPLPGYLTKRSVGNGTTEVPTGLSSADIDAARQVFDLFDFWDGRDGDVDAFKSGDPIKSRDLNQTNANVSKHGGT